MKRTIDRIKEAGLILRFIFRELEDFILIGMSTKEIDFKAKELLLKYNAISVTEINFSGSLFISINTEVMGGVPGDYIIQSGDLISLDMAICYKNVYVDKAITFIVGPAHYIGNYLVYSGKTCIKNASALLKKGVSVRSIGASIEHYAKQQGLQTAREFYGHGIGTELHLLPAIPNFDNADERVLKEDECITIEPVLFYGYYALSKKNEFTTQANVLSCHFEDTYLIKETGMEVIT